MDVTSTYRFARISPRKARDVAREIQGLPVSDALDLLTFTPRKGARLFSKTVKTALADAENNFEIPVDGLVVKSAVVGEGPTFKRFKPRARGSAGAIRKRTSHLTVVLSDESEKTEKAPRTATARAAKVSAPATVENASSDAEPVDGDLGMVYNSPPAEIDDLKLLGGVDPALEEKLNSAGVYRLEQIANWTEENARAFDGKLSLDGRIEKDDWVGQAKALLEEKSDK